ncbi:MAG TPA: L,D-transpeptidase [Rhodoblastus sp.]|nr:L,D-transpeptidase [Rhodoblastus sp.]
MSPVLKFRYALLAGLLMGPVLAPQAQAQFFFPFAEPQTQPQPQQQQRATSGHQRQQQQRRAPQHFAAQQPQQPLPAPRHDQPHWFWEEPEPAPAPQQARRAAPAVDEDGAVVDLAAHNPALDGGYGRRSGVSSAVLPPDADPNYSTPVNLDPDVNYKFKTQKEVNDPTGQPPGTITIDTAKRKLFLSEGGGKAMEYGVGVGKQGFSWKGEATVGRKSYWPGWTPPPEMLQRRPDLPEHMDGSLSNPLGARALYLFQGNKDTLFRIHGTNEPKSIGHAVSSGCIRMHNADVIDLYGRVTTGARVVVR